MAVSKGWAEDIYDSMNLNILDRSFKIDFGRLHEFLVGSDDSSVKKCMLFGSRPPPNDSLWKIAEDKGFEVVVEDRNASNREKKIDTGIVYAMTRDAYTLADNKSDTITLVAGDKDYEPAVRGLVDSGYSVHVVFWDHASKELRDSTPNFISLDKYLNHLSL